MTMDQSSQAAVAAIPPVHKTVTVKASVERAFEIFTADFDSWWPRSHHIGNSPMTRAVIEGKVGGRCYSEQADGTECAWGQVLKWDPPRRFVFAWQVSSEWAFEPDLSKASEVEVRFTAEPDGRTRVDLEHRHFERAGAGGPTVRSAVESANGWGDLLQLFAQRAESV